MDAETKLENLRRAALLDAPTLLREELARRISKNPRYSLRAFAKALKMSPAALSLILAGKYKLSKKGVTKITEILSLAPEQVEHLKKEVSGKKKKYPLAAQSGEYKFITMDVFSVISEWYHYAILNIFALPGFSLEPQWIARKLDIPVMQAKLAIERLKRLELIEEVGGQWRSSALPLRVDRSLSTAAARKFQKQLLLKAIESLENDPSEKRDITSMTFAMDPENLEFASDRITEFRRALTEELEKKGRPRAVYNLTIQLYPITKE